MDYTLVLTAALGGVSATAVSSAETVTGRSPHWLSAGTACEFRAVGKRVLGQVRSALSGQAVDANLVETESRRKQLLVADMDSTIIGCECLDEIADFAGLKPQIAAITERAMRGEVPFESALRERVALLKGLPESVLERVYAERVRLNDGARVLVRTMAQNGALTALVSGGFTFFTARVAEAAGFATHHANELMIEEAKLTGRVREPILGKDAKRDTLLRLVREHNVPLKDTIAIGDGANDLAMIAEAGLGIAYRAKPVLAGAAGIRLDHGDLTAVLHLQGYRETDFVTD